MLNRIALPLCGALLLGASGVAALDYVTFVYRQRKGASVDSVVVRQYLATPLKNGRNEFDYLGELEQRCVRALLPHQKMPPCWWVRQHKDRWTES